MLWQGNPPAGGQPIPASGPVPHQDPLSDLTKLNAALKQAEIDRIAAEQRYRKSEINFASEVAATVGPLIQSRTELQAQYDEKAKLYKGDYPVMSELKARIDRLDAAINSERRRTSTNKRAELFGEFQSAVRIEEELRQKVAEAKGEVVLDRGRSIQYNILQREADTIRCALPRSAAWSHCAASSLGALPNRALHSPGPWRLPELANAKRCTRSKALTARAGVLQTNERPEHRCSGQSFYHCCAH